VYSTTVEKKDVFALGAVNVTVEVVWRLVELEIAVLPPAFCEVNHDNAGFICREEEVRSKLRPLRGRSLIFSARRPDPEMVVVVAPKSGASEGDADLVLDGAMKWKLTRASAETQIEACENGFPEPALVARAFVMAANKGIKTMWVTSGPISVGWVFAVRRAPVSRFFAGKQPRRKSDDPENR